MRPSYHWVLAIAALILLLIAVGIEHPFFSEASRSESVIFNAHSIAALAKELAFALLIALVIATGIERQARQSDAALVAQARQRIAEDVFRGVFEAELPREYVDTVVRTMFKQSVVREYQQVTDTLWRFAPEELSGISHSVSLRRQHRVFAYRLRNVSKYRITHSVRYQMPLRENLEHLAKVLRLKIGERAFEDSELEALRRVDGYSARYSYDIELAPDETIIVSGEAVVAKDASDNDVWGSFLPTLEYEYSLIIEDRPAIFGVRAIAGNELVQLHCDHERGVGRWRMDGPLLPYESVVVWWRT